MNDFLPLRSKDIKKGQRLWECHQFGCIEFEVLNDPIEEDGGFKWEGRTQRRGIISFHIQTGFEHYGPQIYRTPVYMGNQEPLEN